MQQLRIRILLQRELELTLPVLTLTYRSRDWFLVSDRCLVILRHLHLSTLGRTWASINNFPSRPSQICKASVCRCLRSCLPWPKTFWIISEEGFFWRAAQAGESTTRATFFIPPIRQLNQIAKCATTCRISAVIDNLFYTRYSPLAILPLSPS